MDEVVKYALQMGLEKAKMSRQNIMLRKVRPKLYYLSLCPVYPH